jgi:hypothetical protein
MNTERAAYTGWMTSRDRQLFHVLLDGLPNRTRDQVVDVLARNERKLQPGSPEPEPAH